nr:retrovirus-related Pol polyprotein from transposon TNT 1-94 [Tanacetum cinerariifolium]
MSCLPDDIMKLVISCETAKATWTDLVYSFKGLSDTKENRIMDMKLEYQTFKAKPTESLSQTYTRYKTLLNELANDGVNISKHDIDVGFVNNPKDLSTKKQRLVAETFDWDEEEVSDDEEVTEVKVLMTLANDELSVGKNHAGNGEWNDITMRKLELLAGLLEDIMSSNTTKIKDTENEAVRLMMFLLSLTREAKTWLDELNGGTIETEFRGFSKNENESLTDVWLRMKEMLRNCHGHNLSKGNIIKIFYHGLSEITQEVLNVAAGGIFLYKTPNQAYQLLEDKVLLKLDWAKNQKTKSFLRKTVAFAAESSSNSDTDKTMARMDAMTIKMDAQHEELQSRAKKPMLDLDEDDTPILADKQSGRPSRSLPSNTQPNPKGHNSKAYQPPQSRNEHVNAVFTRSGKYYDPPDNPNDQQKETPINFDSDDEDDEPTPQPKTQLTKPVKETPLPKPYKPNFPYPQCLRKEKMNA